MACRCCPGGASRSRRRPRYPSDMSDTEWAVCEPLLPAPAWLGGKGGRPSARCMRDVVDGIRYLTHNGPVWRALPADFPPAWTVYYWTAKWQASGATETMHGQPPHPGTAASRAQGHANGGDHRLPVSQGRRTGHAGQPRLRRWQEDQRTQAPHRRRHDRPAADRADHRRQHPGPRRRQTPCCGTCAKPSPPSSSPGPTAATPASSSAGPRPFSSSPSRSSNGPTTCTPSRCCPAGGSSSGRWPGSPATGAPSETMNGSQPTTKPTSTGP